MYAYMCVYITHTLSRFSHVRPFETPWTVACQALLSMGFSRQEHKSVASALLQGIFLTQGSIIHVYVSVRACMLSHVWTFATPWIVAHQAPLYLGFSKQEYLGGLPFSSPREPPYPRMEPESLAFPALAGRFFTLCHLGSLVFFPYAFLIIFFFHILFHYGWAQDIEYSSLSYTVGLVVYSRKSSRSVISNSLWPHGL